MRAARYYYWNKRQGVTVSSREIAEYCKLRECEVSHTLVAHWVRHWRRGEGYDPNRLRVEARRRRNEERKNCKL